MTKSTIVIDLDAAEPRLIEEWMNAGHWSNLSYLRQDGIYSRLDNTVNYLGWGGHYPYTISASHPPEVFGEVIEKYGKNPVLHNDNGLWWNPQYITWIQQALSEILYELQDAGSGNKIVKQVVITRTEPLDNNPKLPDADVVDRAKLRRAVLLSHCRAGGHIFLGKGPNIPPGLNLPQGETVDLAPNILEVNECSGYSLYGCSRSPEDNQNTCLFSLKN